MIRRPVRKLERKVGTRPLPDNPSPELLRILAAYEEANPPTKDDNDD